MKLGMQVKDMSSTGELRVITGNTMTHGIAGYVNEELDPRFVFEDKITVAMRGQGGKTYYQKGKFLAGHNSMVLLPKDTENFNDSTANYIVSALNKLPFSGYSNYPTLSTYGDYTILLPLAPENTPDWEYMESYISTIEEKYLNTVKAFNDKEMCLLQKLYGVDSDLHIQEPKYGYGDFKVGDLFTFESYSPQLTKSEMNIKEDGDSLFLMQSSENNGVVGTIDTPDDEKFKKVPGNCISAFNHVNKVYYQEESFYCKQGGNMFFLRNENMNKQTGMYLASAISKAIGNVGYGKNTMKAIKPRIIPLPKTSANTPDWEYMEKYISIIAQRERERVAKYTTTKQSRFSNS